MTPEESTDKFLLYLGFVYNTSLDTWDNVKEKLRLTSQYVYRDAMIYDESHFTETNKKRVIQALKKLMIHCNDIVELNCSCDINVLLIKGCQCSKTI